MSFYVPIFAEMERKERERQKALERAPEELLDWWVSMSDTEKLALKRFVSQIGKELEVQQLQSQKRELEKQKKSIEKQIRQKGPIETKYLKEEDL